MARDTKFTGKARQMGMAASQARFLGLTARLNNVEFEGQQINQQRTALSNKSASYYSDLLGMAVPTAPSVEQFTQTVYTFDDGALTNQITSMIAEGSGTFKVSYLKQWTDDFAIVSSNPSIITRTGSGIPTDPFVYMIGGEILRELGDMSDVTGVPGTGVPGTEIPGTGIPLSGTASGNGSTGSSSGLVYTVPNFTFTDTNNTPHSYAYVEYDAYCPDRGNNYEVFLQLKCYDANNNLQGFAVFDGFDTSGNEQWIYYPAGGGGVSMSAQATADKTVEYINGIPFLKIPNNSGGNDFYVPFGGTVNNITYSNQDYAEYTQYTPNAGGLFESGYYNTLSGGQIAGLLAEEAAYLAQLQTEHGNASADYMVRYVQNTTTGEYKAVFYKKDDLDNAVYDNGTGNSISFIAAYEIGSKQRTEEIKAVAGCMLEQDSTGRYMNITIDGKTYSLTTNTVTDQDAYEDAMNQYEYDKALYDQSIAEINAKIEIVQAEDKDLELRLKQLDTEHNALQQEKETVAQVIKKNVENSFKTFG